MTQERLWNISYGILFSMLVVAIVAGMFSATAGFVLISIAYLHCLLKLFWLVVRKIHRQPTQEFAFQLLMPGGLYAMVPLFFNIRYNYIGTGRMQLWAISTIVCILLWAWCSDESLDDASSPQLSLPGFEEK